MEFNKCSRCGSFYLSAGNVCPKCSSKDQLEFSTFKTYISENGFEENLEKVSGETGISIKNLNRFMQEINNTNYLDNNKMKNLGNNSIHL